MAKEKVNGKKVETEQVEKAQPVPDLLPIQKLEFTVNIFLQENSVPLHEAIGFFELKLIEMKESWRSQVARNILASQESANEATN